MCIGRVANVREECGSSMHIAIRMAAVVTMALAAFPRAQALSSAAAGESRVAPGYHLSQSRGQPPAAALESQTNKGTPATVVDDQELDGLLGKNVRSSAGEDMGRVVDILVNKSGNVRAVVIDFGGFLGVGTRKIAVDWNALRFPESGKLDRITLELTRNQVRVAPEYRPGEPVVVLGSSSPNPEPPTDAPTPKTEK